MKACVLYTGGKDSSYTLHWAVLKGVDIKCLLSVKPARDNSWMFHYPAIEYVRLHAEAMGYPLVQARVSGEKEREIEELAEILQCIQEKYDVDTIIAGMLRSDYQRMRVLFIAEKLGMKVYTPLWRIDQRYYMRKLVEHGFRFIIISITAEGLHPKFLGKILTREDIKEIIEASEKYGFNPAFEGGEAETFIVYAPLFKDKAIFVKGESIRRGINEWIYVIKEAKLVDKQLIDQTIS